MSHEKSSAEAQDVAAMVPRITLGALAKAEQNGYLANATQKG